MKRNGIFLSMSLIVIFSMLVGLTTSTAQTSQLAMQASSRNVEMTSSDVAPDLPREQTLYFNGLQWSPVVGWNPYSDSMNNAMAVTAKDAARVAMFETLYLHDMLDGGSYPLLADGDPVWNGARTEITVKLKPAAHWSDGTPLTADDVAYTWDTNLKYSNNAGNNFRDFIDTVTAVDPQTVLIKVKLDGGEAVNPLMVASFLDSIYICQKAWTQTLEARTGGDPYAFLNDPAEDVVWSGPYHKFYADDTIVTLVRDDNYWGQDASMWGRLPSPTYLAHVIYADNEAGIQALKAGEVDVSQQFIANVQDLWLVEGLPISTYLPEAPYGIGASLPTAFYNLNAYGLDNPVIRKAIAIAVDYDLVVANAMTNQSATFEQVPRSLMNTSPGEQAMYDHDAVKDLQWAGNDIVGAQQLLDDAGIIDTNADGWREYNGETLVYTATCPNGWSDWQAAIEIVAAAGQAIGIDTRTNYPEWSEYQTVVTQSDEPLPPGYEIFMMWSDGAGPTQPWGRIRHLMSSEFVGMENNWNGNWGGYVNPAADAIIQAIPHETDPTQLMADYTDLVAIYLTDIPSFTLMYRPDLFHTVNESVWTNFPHQGDGTNPPIPPMLCTDGWSIACLYNLKREPGLSYRYVQTYGETQVPYLADSEHLYQPYGVGVDSNGNLWVSEDLGFRVMKYSSDGNFLMSIGTPGVSGADATHFTGPDDVAVDIVGNIWIADFNSHRVVKFDPSGNYLTQLGVTWEAGSDNDHFNQPVGVALDSAGNIYVSDDLNNRIQIFDSSGVYSATLGSYGSGNYEFNTPRHINFDSNGNLYVADGLNHRVQIFDASLTYIATLGVSGEPGDDNDHLNWPRGVAVDSDHIYVADSDNNRIQIFDRTTYAYQTTLGSYGSGDYQFDKPPDVAVDPDGNLFVVDWYNQRVQKYDNNLVYVHTFGTTGVPYLTDKNHYNQPWGITTASYGGMYIFENLGHRLIKLNPDGSQAWTVGKAGVFGSDNDTFGYTSYWGDIGNPAETQDGKVYVPDTGNNRIQVFDADTGDYLSTFGEYGQGNDQFDWPSGVTINPTNQDILIPDQMNHRVQIYTSDWVYKTNIGETGVPGDDNDHFNRPCSVAVDNSGAIFVAETVNMRVQKCTTTNDINYTCSTFIAAGTNGGFDNILTRDVELDSAGRVYVISNWINNLQIYDASGAYLTSIGGNCGSRSGDLCYPQGVSVDQNGNIFVADTNNHRIQKYAPGVPDWKQVNINGFGNPNIGNIPSMEVFNDYLYVGTHIWPDGPHHLYRTSNSQDWEEVEHDFDDGISSLMAFDNQLSAGTWSGSLWSSTDGISWTQVMSSSFGIASFGKFNNTLYAGTYCGEGEGATIWKTSNGISWTPFVTNGNGDPNACGAISSAEFAGDMYFGVSDWSGTSGGRIWRTDGITITEVVSDGFGNSANFAPSGLAVLGDAIFASINTPDGYQVWSSDSGDLGSWEMVLEVSLGTYGGRTGLIAFNNHLFLTIQDDQNGLQVWRLADSETWEQVGFDGFGDSNNGWTEWASNLDVFHNQLYIGANNYANGGEIWRYEPEVTADFTATPTDGIAPLEVTFTNTSTGTLTANLWIFGDGTTSTDTNPVHTYDSSGVYPVTLLADSFGNKDTKTINITVYAPVSADFSASPTSGPFPLTVAFTNLSAGTFDTCLWDFGDTCTSALCNPADHVYQSTGVHTVTLTTSGLGGSDIETKDSYITVENQKFFLPLARR